MQLPSPIKQLMVGRLGTYDFAAGYYLYVGSAFGPGGVQSRVRRHMKRVKTRTFWHIDYLSEHTRMCQVWSIVCPIRLEQPWCQALENHYPMPVLGFGASDSSCSSHLFYAPREPSIPLLSQVLATILVPVVFTRGVSAHVCIELPAD
jgi:Uri superfamily endonuclease